MGPEPLTTRAEVTGLGRTFPLEVVPGGEPEALVDEVETTERCSVLRVGIKPPAVRLQRVVDGACFTLKATKKLALELGKSLGQEIDAEVVLRYVDDDVVGGRLTGYEAVTADDPMGAWTDWITERNRSCSVVAEEEADRPDHRSI